MNVAQTTRSRHPGAPAGTPAWQVAGAMDRVLALRYALVALTVRPVPAQDDPA